MSKKIKVVPAVGKHQFNYRCKICEKWRPLTRYEPLNEAKKIIAALIEYMPIPADGQRFFIGPVCGAECLRSLEENIYEIVELGEEDGETGREKD
jgi:hypothetical protein